MKLIFKYLQAIQYLCITYSHSNLLTFFPKCLGSCRTLSAANRIFWKIIAKDGHKIKITNHRPQSDLESDHEQFLLNCQWANTLKRFHEQATGAMYHSDQDINILKIKKRKCSFTLFPLHCYEV